MRPRREVRDRRAAVAAVKKGCAPPAHPVFAACERLTEAWQSLLEYLAFRAKELKLELLDYCRRELAPRKERRQLTAYQDLLLRLDRALGAPGGAALAASLRRRYSAALIDEFQDTDPIQYGIFRRIYGRSRLPVFLIGDPKQAIYGFRGADIFAYLAAGRDAEARRTLDRNWRSAPGLVQAVNAVFGRRRRTVPVRRDRVPPGAAGRDGADSRSSSRGTTRRRSGSGASPAWTSTSRLSKGKAADAAIQATAAEIARLLAAGRPGRGPDRGGSAPGGDIAVLVRTNAQADRVREALLERGSPASSSARPASSAPHEAAEIERVLLAVAQPGREPLVRAALATDLFGLRRERAGGARRGRGGLGGRGRTRSWSTRALWRDQGFVQMFRRLMKAEGVAARLLGFEDGERRLTNVLHLTELLQAAAAADHLGMDGLIDWLAAHRQSGETAPEEAQLRLESDENLVKIATIHKSKGLQYPVVFCPFLWDVSLRGQGRRAGRPVPRSGRGRSAHAGRGVGPDRGGAGCRPSARRWRSICGSRTSP